MGRRVPCEAGAHFDGSAVDDPLDPEVSARLLSSGWHTVLDVPSGAGTGQGLFAGAEALHG